MRQCRPMALLGLIAVLSLMAPLAQAQTCVPAWSATQVYTAGNQASQNNTNFKANWWTQGDSPDTHNGGAGSGQPWTSIGACGGSSDTTAPTVAITAPVAGTTVSGVVTVTANASDAGSGVASVTLVVDGAAVGAADTSSPYSFSWNSASVANGSHNLAARAVDVAGNSATSAARSVTVNNGTSGCQSVPGTPGNFRSTGKSNSFVDLAWNTVAPPSGCASIQYRVFQNGAQIAQIGGTTHRAQGLSGSTTYRFSVEAVTDKGAGTRTAEVSVTTDPNPVGGSKIIGYFAQWGVYARNYHVKNIETSGSASKLTHINYAFGNVSGGQCVIGDSFADFDKFYDASASVDGVSDTWDAGALRGSFGQLRRLKQMHPNLRVLFSFGGWTWSGGFAQAAANPTAFANSCFNLLHDPRWNGVFDGIDIDWEYPNECGLSCDSSGPDAFTKLMQALRQRFGNELITAALPAGETKINATNYAAAAQYVNWYNIMTYDFFGSWAAAGPTAPHSPLTSFPGIPEPHFYGDFAIQLYKSKGVSPTKLLLGVGFYGRGWSGVSSANGGLGQAASGAAPGTFEAGNEDYHVLAGRCPATGTVGGTAMAFCGGQWWSYDTPATLASKMTYKKNQGLAGTFFWELSGDTSNGTLINALFNNR